MPCYQPTNFPPGFTTTGRTSYRTEAECNQACEEGACCEGTTCSVKPQCQCQCTTGRCCGPDTITAAETTWKTCRNETKAQCDARGGVFQCGVSCSGGVLGDAAGTTGGSVCLAGTGDVANAGPVFKGVGTVCTPNPCLCPGCGTMCPAPGCLPTYIDISYSCSFPNNITTPGQSFSGTVTLQKAFSEGCGIYEFYLAGAGASSLGASEISISLTVGTTGATANFFFLRKITAAYDKIDPCFGPFGGFGRFDGLRILRMVSATAATPYLPGDNASDGTWAGWEGQAYFITPFGLLNDLCYSSGTHSYSQAQFGDIDETALNAPCTGSTATVITKGVVGNVISVTLLRSYN